MKINPAAARRQRPLRAAAQILWAGGKPVIFEIHREWEVGNEIQRSNLIRQFREGVEAFRGHAISFSLHLHPEQVMHDRFILTDRGGLQIGHGLDDNEDGGSAPTANIILLEQCNV